MSADSVMPARRIATPTSAARATTAAPWAGQPHVLDEEENAFSAAP